MPQSVDVDPITHIEDLLRIEAHTAADSPIIGAWSLGTMVRWLHS